MTTGIPEHLEHLWERGKEQKLRSWEDMMMVWWAMVQDLVCRSRHTHPRTDRLQLLGSLRH